MASPTSPSVLSLPVNTPVRSSAEKGQPSAAVADSGTPASAVVAIVAAWVFFALTVAFYSLGAILLLPFLPVFLFGPVCLLSAAHGYANEVRERRK